MTSLAPVPDGFYPGAKPRSKQRHANPSSQVLARAARDVHLQFMSVCVSSLCTECSVLVSTTAWHAFQGMEGIGKGRHWRRGLDGGWDDGEEAL